MIMDNENDTFFTFEIGGRTFEDVIESIDDIGTKALDFTLEDLRNLEMSTRINDENPSFPEYNRQSVNLPDLYREHEIQWIEFHSRK